MCIPLAVMVVASMVMSAASAAVSYIDQKNAADDQLDYAQDMYDETAKSAKANYFEQLAAIEMRGNQEKQAASQEAIDVQKSHRDQQADAENKIADNGIMGNTVEMLRADYQAQEDRNLNTLEQNYLWRRMQDHEDAKSLRAQAASQMHSARSGPINGPSALATGLQVGSSVASAYGYGMDRGMNGGWNGGKGTLTTPKG